MFRLTVTRPLLYLCVCLVQVSGLLDVFGRQADVWPNPKPETRRPKEGRSPKSEEAVSSSRNVALSGTGAGRLWSPALYCACGRVEAGSFGLRVSDFFRPSDFGLRVCALDSTGNVRRLPSPGAVESWPAALARMPLGANVTQLNRTNCVGILLRAFQSNDVVKALVFMPGATDEFYFFRRAKADLTNGPSSLLDAVSALTNQTLIRATFRPPLLLLHTAEDLLEPAIKIEHQPTADKLKQARFVAHGIYDDRDWDYMWRVLKSSLRTDLLPWPRSHDSWHFYRHSFAAWNLTGWEALQATALAGETAVTVRRKQVMFEFDGAPARRPRVDAFPR